MASSNYFSFAAANRRFITFGFLAAFTSSFGQTYFIGIFGPAIQAEFGLSHTTWGSIYLLGTLASAVVLTFSGKLIDYIPLRCYTFLVLGLLILACGSIALVSGTVTLVCAIFLLRHAGQGLMSHIAMTTMARYFYAGRGKALAIATLGYSAGEALLPILAVLAIAAFGWRWTYGGVALLLGLVLMPILCMLPKGFDDRMGKAPARDSDRSRRSGRILTAFVVMYVYESSKGLSAPRPSCCRTRDVFWV